MHRSRLHIRQAPPPPLRKRKPNLSGSQPCHVDAMNLSLNHLRIKEELDADEDQMRMDRRCPCVMCQVLRVMCRDAFYLVCCGSGLPPAWGSLAV